MNVRINRAPSQVQVSRKTMADFMIRATAEQHAREEWDRLCQKRGEELEAYATALDATMLWTLHSEYGFGRRRLRRFWEQLIHNRVEFRSFYRGDMSTYEVQNTGSNAEDFALVAALRDIGVDLEAWEAEPLEIDNKTGEVTFGIKHS